MLPAIFIGLFSIIFSFLLAVSFVIFAIVPALPVTLSLLTALVLGNLVIAFFAIKKSVHSVIALIGFAIGSFIMMFSMSKEGPSLSLDVIEFPALATVVFASVYAVCYWLLKKTILKDTTEVQAA